MDNKEIINKIIDKQNKKRVLSVEIRELIFSLLNELKEKEKEVLVKRFGLKGKKSETLEQIGRSRGVTRERIRQIEKSSIKKLKRTYLPTEDIKILEDLVIQVLEEYGGLMEENHLIDVLLDSDDNKKNNKQAVLFAINHLFEDPQLLKDHKNFHNSWYLPKVSFDNIAEIIAKIEQKIKDNNKPVNQNDLIDLLSDIESNKKVLEAYLQATKIIKKNNFGEWGLPHWPTITPKRVGDKVYLVLKRSGKHLHFREITDLINSSSFDDARVVNLGTVHNELIMDDRYVLIGRGVYALREWGYYTGTVSDVIVQLLKDKGPLTRQEIIESVSSQRLVRENTIKVSLMNKKIFKKIDKKKYGLVSSEL